MTSESTAETRSPISLLFAAALDGDRRATRVLDALADDDTTATDADADEARRALAALDEHRSDGSTAYDDEQLQRVWATGYVDQLLARYRDAGGYREGRADLAPRTDSTGELQAPRRIGSAPRGTRSLIEESLADGVVASLRRDVDRQGSARLLRRRYRACRGRWCRPSAPLRVSDRAARVRGAVASTTRTSP